MTDITGLQPCFGQVSWPNQPRLISPRLFQHYVVTLPSNMTTQQLIKTFLRLILKTNIN